MLLKRQIPIIIVIVVGILTLFGHFINNAAIANYVDNDSTQWFDIIASFAIFLGALNLLKLQLLKIFKKQRNWQYSILAVGGFFFSIFAGFLFRGSNTITVDGIANADLPAVSKLVADETGAAEAVVYASLSDGAKTYTIPKIYITKSRAEEFAQKISPFASSVETQTSDWGAHLQAKKGESGSLFYWMFQYIFTPLSATMFALLAFFVASASYRAFRIRNFEATLLLSAGIILMLGRVPIGQMISPWIIAIFLVMGLGALAAPFIRDRRYLFGGVVLGIAIVLICGYIFNFDPKQPFFLYLPVLQEWIFNFPTTAGARAIMIGIGLGIVGTSFRIIVGLERSFLGEN